jgi:hypothetical protein
MCESSCSSSDQCSVYTTSDSENSDEVLSFDREIQPYDFEPVYDVMSDSDSHGHGEMEVEQLSEHSDDESRLQSMDW